MMKSNSLINKSPWRFFSLLHRNCSHHIASVLKVTVVIWLNRLLFLDSDCTHSPDYFDSLTFGCHSLILIYNHILLAVAAIKTNQNGNAQKHQQSNKKKTPSMYSLPFTHKWFIVPLLLLCRALRFQRNKFHYLLPVMAGVLIALRFCWLFDAQDTPDIVTIFALRKNKSGNCMVKIAFGLKMETCTQHYLCENKKHQMRAYKRDQFNWI